MGRDSSSRSHSGKRDAMWGSVRKHLGSQQDGGRGRGHKIPDFTRHDADGSSSFGFGARGMDY